MSSLTFRRARPDDAPRLDAIRRAAFEPVFASFRSILGDELYEAAQRQSDDGQGDLLASLLAGDSGWSLYVAESRGEIVGFVAVRLDTATKVGELGLNAVAPERAGHGIGTAMYEFAVARLQEGGMNVATVGTGGDPSHAPARRAYRKAGFDVELPTVWMYRSLR
ncbi:MAG TPA: GNAT family N-acetyltransferase [Polyangiaceae bacterium]